MKYLIAIIVLSSSINLSAQNLNFNQSHLTGLYSNPALTGFNQERKISAVYRNESPTFSGNSISTFVSYEDGYSKYGSFGAYYLNDLVSNGSSVNNRFGFNYAKPFQLTPNLVISAGINATVVHDHINWEKLTFGDMMHPRSGTLYDPLNSKKNYFSTDFSAGLFLKFHGLYGGVSFNQFGGLTEFPLYNFYSNIGYQFKTKKEDGLSISPEISLNTFQGFHNMSCKISAFYKWAKLGIESNGRSESAIIVGARIKSFDVSFSTEWTHSKLSETTSFSYELGISKKFNKKKSETVRTYFNSSLF